MESSILIVEDEAAIRDMLSFALSGAGFHVAFANDTDQALHRLTAQRPDLIVLDWMLPGQPGVEFARRLRASDETRDIPIIMLTARGEEAEKIRGLESGADDYMTKPFSPKELVARIKAVLRRSGVNDGETITVEDLTLDQAAHRAVISGAALELGPTEYKLLAFFMTHQERVYSRGQLLDRVWGNNIYVEERTVDVHIRRLRKALEPSGYDRLIQTVRGTGYRFSAQE